MKRSTPMKRTRMKYNPPRPGSTKEAERTLDDLTRKIVLLQEKRCFTCPSTSGLQCGHLFERRHRGTRQDVLPDGNNHAQCPRCNSNHEDHPQIYIDAYVARFGQLAYDILVVRAHQNQKLTYSELLDMITERETLLASLGGVSRGGNE